MAARKPTGGASTAPTEAPKKAASQEPGKTTVSVSLKKPYQRRWRAGLCFTSEPRVETVTGDVLKALEADPLLIVEHADGEQA